MQCAGLWTRHSQPVGQLLDEVPSLGEVLFFHIKKKKKKLLAECCGQTKQKTEKFTVHRCTAVQYESKNLSQRDMADCGLWLSRGISSSDKDKPLHYAGKSIFFDDTV